jgi:hypothetical protein
MSVPSRVGAEYSSWPSVCSDVERPPALGSVTVTGPESRSNMPEVSKEVALRLRLAVRAHGMQWPARTNTAATRGMGRKISGQQTMPTGEAGPVPPMGSVAGARLH